MSEPSSEQHPLRVVPFPSPSADPRPDTFPARDAIAENRPTQEDNSKRHRGFKKRILVTGSNRSGTTFLGQILAANRDTVYAYEPFSPKHGLERIDRWYLYLEEGLPIERELRPQLDAFMLGRGRFRRRSVGRGVSPGRRLFRACFRSINHFRYASGSYLHPRGDLLIKDPIALLSCNYLSRRYGCETVILLRHPCAYYASLKRMGWHMGPEVLLSQPEFAEKYLPEYVGYEPGYFNRDYLTAAAYVWLFLYTAASRLAAENPNLVLLRHEDLSIQPMAEVEALCRKLRIPFTARIRRRIENLTSPRNPVEARQSQTHTLRRDSARNAYLWREKLEGWEIRRVMSICGNRSSQWY